MKTHPQAHEGMSHVAEKIEGQRVAMLTLLEPPAGLSARPMTPIEMDSQGAIWIMTSKKSLIDLIGPEGEAVNLAFSDEGDSTYVSIAGVGHLIDDKARKEELWSPMGRPWFDGPTDPDYTLLKVTPTRAEIWDGPNSSVVRLLGMAASVVAGKQIGMGDKEVIDAPKAR